MATDSGCKTVGLALMGYKWKKHVSDELLSKAKANGLHLKLLDPDVPLEAQGPLDAVLQKLRRPDWEQQLERYAAAHPHVKVFDPPSATMPIRNRGTMLTMLEGEGWVFQEPAPPEGCPPRQYRVCVPTNTTVQEGTSASMAAEQLQRTGLRYPMLAKPVWADGREGSHALAVVGTPVGLERLVEGAPELGSFGLPVLVQQYVDHGGCLFKVYVLGSIVVMVKRSSLQLPPMPSAGRCPAAVQQPTGAAASGAEAAPAAPTPACHCKPPATIPSSSPSAAAAALAEAACGHAACTLKVDARTLARNPAAAHDPAPTQTPSPLPSASEECEVPMDLELVERVSAYPRCKSWGKWDLAPKGHGVVSPPTWLVHDLAQRLRRHLGLNLFNFDVIVPLPKQQQQAMPPIANGRTGTAVQGGDGGGSPAVEENGSSCGGAEAKPPMVYYVIDINYFPGYEKLPGYEDIMVQFLASIWSEDEMGEQS